MNSPNLIFSNYFDYVPGFRVIRPERPLSVYRKNTPRQLLLNGLRSVSYARLLETSEGVDELFRSKDPAYMKFCKDFIENTLGARSLLMFDYNFLHPEILFNDLSNVKKIMAFIDDPHSTYTRGLPYISAFDAVVHISKTYINNQQMDGFLKRSGAKNVRWHPLVNPNLIFVPHQELASKKMDLISYIGAPSYDKYNTLASLKRTLGDKFKLYGRWRFCGCYGFVAPVDGNIFLPKRIKSISNAAKHQIMVESLVGLNMHCTNLGESGNARTYEIAAYGCVPLVEAHQKGRANIFSDDTQVFYESPEHAVELFREIVAHKNSYLKISENIHDEFWQKYNPIKVWNELSSWIDSL